MILESKYNIGDKVWCWWGDNPRILTIGQIRVVHTGGQTKEEYMCVETGVGSGSCYYLESLYDTLEECIAGNEMEVLEAKKREERRKREKEDALLREEKSLMKKVEELQRIKEERGWL